MSKNVNECNKCAVCNCMSDSSMGSSLTFDRTAACGVGSSTCSHEKEAQINASDIIKYAMTCRSSCVAFQQCADKRDISFCHQCNLYPCTKFNRLASKAKEVGVDLKYNQKVLEVMGEKYFSDLQA